MNSWSDEEYHDFMLSVLSSTLAVADDVFQDVSELYFKARYTWLITGCKILYRN